MSLGFVSNDHMHINNRITEITVVEKRKNVSNDHIKNRITETTVVEKRKNIWLKTAWCVTFCVTLITIPFVVLYIEVITKNRWSTVYSVFPNLEILPDFIGDNCILIPDKGVTGTLEKLSENMTLFITACLDSYIIDFTHKLPIVKNVPNNLDFFVQENDLLKFSTKYNNAIYVSYVNYDNVEKCYTVDVLKASLLDNLTFSVFHHSPDHCIGGWYCSVASNCLNNGIHLHATGGKMLGVSNGLILSVGDFLSEDSLAQNDSSYFGKMLLVSFSNLSVSIISKGHRNPQGLFQVSECIVLQSEHGPKGGDELNIIDICNASHNNNYGWPLVSYGNHYNGVGIPSVHSPQYIEPIAYFEFSKVGSHGIGDIKVFNNMYLIATLNGRRMYKMLLDNEFRILMMEYIVVNNRVRSIVVLNECDVILLTEMDKQRRGPLIKLDMCDNIYDSNYIHYR